MARHHSVPTVSHSPPAVSSAAFLDRLRSLGLTGIDRCTFTHNRTTIASFRGSHLRVHHALGDAQPTVLLALVDFVNGRGALRRRARRELLAFPLPDRQATGAHRQERSHPADAGFVARLVDAHRQLNRERFADALGNVTIRVSRRMRTRLGHFSPGHDGSPPEIAIAHRHLKRDGWEEVVDTLAHEMVHQWQYETQRPLAHDRAFRGKARLVGIHGAAKRVTGRRS